MIVLQGARERVELLAFSPDGRFLVAPRRDGVQVWLDPTAGGPPKTVLPSYGWPLVRFTPDGKELIVGGDYGLEIYDIAAWQASGTRPEMTYCSIFSFDLTPDGQLLVATRELQDLLYCRSMGELESDVWITSTEHEVWSRPLFLADGERFVTFERTYHTDLPVFVTYDTRSGEVVYEVFAAGRLFCDPVLSPDRRLLASRDGIWAAVFRPEDMAAEPVVIRNDNRQHFTGLAFHPSGSFLAATSNDATVKLYDTSTWKVAQVYDWDIGRLRSVAFSPDGMLAAAGGDRGKIVVWDVDL
jgi:WD40 repeat protein